MQKSDINILENKQKCILLLEEYMIPITGGSFAMGTPEHSEYCFLGEKPLHIVTVSNFKISSIPITRRMYNLFNSDYEIGNEDEPATNITWQEAYEFCQWIGCDLPTEAEWEYSCKAGKNDNWFCNEEELHEYCWFSQNSKSKLHEVAELRPNNFGMYDMLGNVWEWCSDFYSEDFYSSECKLNPICLEDNFYKVCRGGSYFSFKEMCRCNFRWKEPIDFKAKDLGFRVVKRN